MFDNNNKLCYISVPIWQLRLPIYNLLIDCNLSMSRIIIKMYKYSITVLYILFYHEGLMEHVGCAVSQ